MSREALWQAILENPEDRTVRLIYADWLEEHSDDPEDLARAELIRGQIAIESHPPRSRKLTSVRKRVREILKTYQKKWTAPLHGASEPEFRGGFLEHVRMGATEFARKGAQILDAHPTVVSVAFPAASNELDALLASELLPRLRQIDLSNLCSCGHCGIQEELITLARSEQLAGIRHLGLSGNRMEERTLQALVESPHLGSLRSLDLSNNPLTIQGTLRPMLVLLRAPWLRQLERLKLTGIPLSDALRRVLEGRVPGQVVVDPPSEA
jgi:uncharacterized protein (TIGR02996 family)